jgi:hypothetical protein
MWNAPELSFEFFSFYPTNASRLGAVTLALELEWHELSEVQSFIF